MNKIFQSVIGAKVQRSTFDLGHYKIFDCDMGQLIPVLYEDCIPGDIFNIGANFIIRAQPLVHPILHPINIYAHYYFIPYRILDDRFEDFYTKGITGDYEGTLEDYCDEIPPPETLSTHMRPGSIIDFVTGASSTNAVTRNNRNFTINAFIKQAYNFVYNEYYRDQDFIEPVNLNQGQILNCAWEKDYFTAARKKQQRGTSPAFPIMGRLPLQGYSGLPLNASGVTVNNQAIWGTPGPITTDPARQQNILALPGNAQITYLGTDLNNAVSFNINDLREATQLQLWMELNSRGGVRFTEFLQTMFNVSPRDERLDRPEYIGGLKAPIIISEVLQTSSTQSQPSPQGTLAGHGISVTSNKVGKYHVKEPGCIIGLMSIRPRTIYMDQINKTLTHETPFDFVFPTFTHLSEKGVMGYEFYSLLAVNNNLNNPTWNRRINGFMPMYDEYRYRGSIIANNMKTTLNTWHLGRTFNSSNNLPYLNKSFIEMDCSTPVSTNPYVPNPYKRIFAVPSEPGWVVNWGNTIIASRPIPYLGNPGRLDHT